VRIGLSGWRYRPWRGVFYPKDLKQREELAFAASRFETLEINGTFYSLQRPGHFERWYDATPEDFVFAVKGPRYITHMLKLRNVQAPLANFLASGLFRLGHKLGPMLWQFPERFAFDAERFESFFEMLPPDTDAAARLARKHDHRLVGRSALRIRHPQPLRHAVEIRHESFRDPAFVRLLRRHRVGLVVADTVEWPLLMDLTADFVYCRLHGSKELYVSGYGPADIRRWATRVQCWAAGTEPADALRVLPASRPRSSGRDVYVYFDNDAKVRAPADADALKKRLTSASRTRPRRP
jgi:uncharacterized protein YecE (DUF72 family)